jgi:hypothetical protein
MEAFYTQLPGRAPWWAFPWPLGGSWWTSFSWHLPWEALYQCLWLVNPLLFHSHPAWHHSAEMLASSQAWGFLFSRIDPFPPALSCFLLCEIEGCQWILGVMPPSFMLSTLSSHDGETRQRYYFVIVIWPQNAAHQLKPRLLNYFSLTVC